jgi:hypothetical protein
MVAPPDISSQSNTTSGDGGEPRDVAQIKAEVEETREELGRTVEALSAKLDFKTRARQRMGVLKQQAVVRVHGARVMVAQLAAGARSSATDEQGAPKAVVPAVGAVIAVLTLSAVMAWRRRRR